MTRAASDPLWKRLIRPLGIGLLAALPLVFFGCDRESGGDRSVVSFSPAQLLIGREQTDRQETCVHLENVGSAPVNVTELKTTCGCTVSDQPVPFPLSPGERKRIPIKVNLPRYGRKDVVITARFMTPGNPATTEHETQGRLTLDGGSEPVPAIQRIPPRLVLSRSSAEQSVAGEFVIATAEPVGSLWITGAGADSGNVHVQLLSQSEQPGDSPDVVRREYHFEVSVGATAALRGGLLDHLEIRFDRNVGDDQSGRLSRIPVLLQSTDPIRCVPGELVLRDEEIVPGECVLIFADDRSWEVTPSVSHTCLEVTPVGEQAVRVRRFLVSITNQPVPSPVSGELAARFLCRSGDETCEIVLPVARFD